MHLSSILLKADAKVARKTQTAKFFGRFFRRKEKNAIID
jgi:hypothetical protein